VEQANIRFLSRPLGGFLEKGIAQAPRTQAVTPFEKNVNPLLKLPKTLKWPRSSKGKIITPSKWRGPSINGVVKNKKQADKLNRLRAMSNVAIDTAIEVPGRAFFFIVAEGRTKLKKSTLLLQYESGQLLYQLMGYNRCRLFTVTREAGPKRIPQIDTALTWSGLYAAFEAAKDRYPFATYILDLFEPQIAGGSLWKNNTNFPFGTC
jgi:hypothetical protein